jgi:hypothetical protein
MAKSSIIEDKQMEYMLSDSDNDNGNSLSKKKMKKLKAK